jgi:hypothetical protein
MTHFDICYKRKSNQKQHNDKYTYMGRSNPDFMAKQIVRKQSVDHKINIIGTG